MYFEGLRLDDGVRGRPEGLVPLAEEENTRGDLKPEVVTSNSDPEVIASAMEHQQTRAEVTYHLQISLPDVDDKITYNLS